MIYCLEDDADIRELELYTLNSMNFKAEGFADAQSFFQAIAKELPELVVLDVMLPDMSGVKKKKKDLGADDYMTKPFSVMEMVARIKAILRRSNEGSDAKGEVKFGKIVINEVKHSVTADDKKLDLSLKEFELLLLLIKHPGRVYSRDELLNLIWGIDYDGENRTVDVHIRALRSKLGDLENVIQTVRGIGYKADA